MNDFTKEELQIILLDMNTYIHRTPMLTESPIHKTLRDKIESIIDNYCDHDWKLCYAEDIYYWCKKCKAEKL